MRYSAYIITFFTALLLYPEDTVFSQAIPEPVADEGIYSFIDELACDGIITLNQSVKPYSRKLVSEKLDEAVDAVAQLTPRQRKELDLWLTAYGTMREHGRVKLMFNPATIRYSDSLFTITASPVLGLSYGSDNAVAWKNGARVYGSYGNWAFFATLQDNHQDPLVGDAAFLTRERGGHIKNGTDFSEMTGGVSYSWPWGDISFLKDSPVWGSGYAGANIFSGRAPSFMQIRLRLKPVRWGEMTYFFGWLNSMVIDSTRSFWVTNAYGTDYREVYHRKYISANLFTISPFHHFTLSAGNSVIWSDPRLTPHFLMPFFFYKSVDHGVNSGIDNSNSQMFIDVSSHNIRHLHLYGTLFIDELSTARFFNSDYNFFSWKAGARTGNFRFLRDLWLTAECTFTYPLTFQHIVPVTTFETQGYNLGHWLRDNSRSWYLAADYKPLRGMNIRLWHERSERGPDYQSLGGPRLHLPYLETVEWSCLTTGMEIRYVITGGVQAKASLVMSNVNGRNDWYPEHLYGKTTTLTGGLAWGF